MKKVFIVFMVFIYSILLGINIYLLETPKIEEINISDQINEDLTKNVVVKIKNIFNKNVKCKINDSNWIKPINNECSFNLESGNYKVYLKINKNLTISKKFNVEVNKILGLNVKNEKIYLAIDENYKLSYEIEKIGNVDEVIKYIIDDENILKIENDTIIPLNVGSTNITLVTSNDLKKTINVIVTDLFRKADLSNNYVKLSCYRYTMDEAHILDEALSFKINEAGYQTRGAVVAAARFLILNFPYKVTYFGENGRLSINGRYADGEGRYYHKGLYLSTDKFSEIVHSITGPSIWGCPLVQINEEPYPTYQNGLDCSGFVSWVLYNAGFDVGDIGAGITYGIYDLSDLGIHNDLTRDFIYNGSYKVGDLIGIDGHAAIIAGIDEDHVYVAESLLNGVVIETYRKDGNDLYRLYSYINNMDDVYINEGNYSNMW